MCDEILHYPQTLQTLQTIPVVLSPEATLPSRGTPYSAGLDLYASRDTLINDTSTLVPTGVRMAIPQGYVGMIKSRSSMAMKNVYTEAGIIDSDYRGEIKVCLYYNGLSGFAIHKGEKIAQLLIIPVCMNNCVLVESLPSTSRGEGGFGSTGV